MLLFAAVGGQLTLTAINPYGQFALDLDRPSFLEAA
jgi:hypothetical protein